MPETVNQRFAREVLQSNPHTAKIVNDLVAALEGMLNVPPDDDVAWFEARDAAQSAISRAKGSV